MFLKRCHNQTGKGPEWPAAHQKLDQPQEMKIMIILYGREVRPADYNIEKWVPLMLTIILGYVIAMTRAHSNACEVNDRFVSAREALFAIVVF